MIAGSADHPLFDKLRSLVGAAHVLAGVDCSPYVLEGRTPEAVAFPARRRRSRRSSRSPAMKASR